MSNWKDNLINWIEPPVVISSIVAFYWLMQFGAFNLLFNVFSIKISNYLSFMTIYIAIVAIIGLPILKNAIWFGGQYKLLLLIAKLFVSLSLSLLFLFIYTIMLIIICPEAYIAAGFGHEFTIFPLAIVIGHFIVFIVFLLNGLQRNGRLFKGGG
ncbi:MAG: hypothetical protein WC500_02580 [Candidatus Margulisiibacteriota bacterium]